MNLSRIKIYFYVFQKLREIRILFTQLVHSFPIQRFPRARGKNHARRIQITVSR